MHGFARIGCEGDGMGYRWELETTKNTKCTKNGTRLRGGRVRVFKNTNVHGFTRIGYEGDGMGL